MSSDGRPTVSNTITMVTKPADGIPAAPIEAAVAVTLQIKISSYTTVDDHLSPFCKIETHLTATNFPNESPTFRN